MTVVGFLLLMAAGFFLYERKNNLTAASVAAAKPFVAPVYSADATRTPIEDLLALTTTQQFFDYAAQHAKNRIASADSSKTFGKTRAGRLSADGKVQYLLGNFYFYEWTGYDRQNVYNQLDIAVFTFSDGSQIQLLGLYTDGFSVGNTYGVAIWDGSGVQAKVLWLKNTMYGDRVELWDTKTESRHGTDIGQITYVR